MAEFARIMPCGAYVRLFKSGEYDTNTLGLLVDDLVFERDFCDITVIAGCDPLPGMADAIPFYFEGQSGPLDYQDVFQDNTRKYFWSVGCGDTADEPLYCALLQGGKATSSSSNNYYYPLVTSDKETFYTTGQTVLRVGMGYVTAYENNPDYQEPNGSGLDHATLMLTGFALRKAGVPMAELIAQML